MRAFAFFLLDLGAMSGSSSGFYSLLLRFFCSVSSAVEAVVVVVVQEKVEELPFSRFSVHLLEAFLWERLCETS